MHACSAAATQLVHAQAAASLLATHAELAATLAEVHPSFAGDSDAVQLEWQRYTSKVSCVPRDTSP